MGRRRFAKAAALLVLVACCWALARPGAPTAAAFSAPAAPAATSTLTSGRGFAPGPARAVRPASGGRRVQAIDLEAVQVQKSKREGFFILCKLVFKLTLCVLTFVWFFKAVKIIDRIVAFFPQYETPIFLSISLLPIWLSRSKVIEDAMRESIGALAKITKNNVTRHAILSLWEPLAGIIDALLIFLPVNLIAQSVQEGWQMILPKQWVFLDPNGDGILTATELEDAVGSCSQRVLYAVFASYIVMYILRLKQPPKDFDPDTKDNSALANFWRGLVRRSGLTVLGNLALDAGCYIGAGYQWLKAFGVDPLTVLTFGGIGGIAFGLASQSLVSNIISGILILVTRPFTAGDFIETDEVEGYVRKIGWVFTEIETGDGPLVTVPNSELNEKKATNRSLGDFRKFKVKVPIRFPQGSFDKCRPFLAGLEDHIMEFGKKSLRGGKVKFSEPPEARLLEIVLDSDGGPVLMLEMEVCCVNEGLGDHDDVQSEVIIEVISYVKSKGNQVPGVEF